MAVYAFRDRFTESANWRLKDPLGNIIQIIVVAFCVTMSCVTFLLDIGTMVGRIGICVWSLILTYLMIVLYQRTILAIRIDRERVYMWRNRIWEELELDIDPKLRIFIYPNGIIRFRFRVIHKNRWRYRSLYAWCNLGYLERDRLIEKLKENLKDTQPGAPG